MDSFGQRVAEWQVFYAAMAGVSATLVGLLFVALYMNVDLFLQSGNEYLKRTARMVFGSFIVVLFCALIFLIPHQTRLGLALPVGAAGLIGLADTLLASGDARRWRSGIPPELWGRIRAGLVRSFLGRVALVAACGLLFMEVESALVWIAVPLLAALLSACRNCWDLLVGTRERLNSQTANPPP